MRLLAFFLSLAVCLPASAQIYRYTDAQGNVVFTDKLPPNANVEKVETGPVNSIPAAPVPKTSASNTPDSTDVTSGTSNPFAELRIVNVPDADAIRANNGNFTINVLMNPPLATSMELQLLVDGAPYGSPSNSPSFEVQNLDRGEHQLAVQVISGGTILQTSEAVPVSVQRVHLGNRPRK